MDYARSQRSYTDATTGQQASFTDFEGPRLRVVPVQDFFVMPLTVRRLDDAEALGTASG